MRLVLDRDKVPELVLLAGLVEGVGVKLDYLFGSHFRFFERKQLGAWSFSGSLVDRCLVVVDNDVNTQELATFSQVVTGVYWSILPPTQSTDDCSKPLVEVVRFGASV